MSAVNHTEPTAPTDPLSRLLAAVADLAQSSPLRVELKLGDQVVRVSVGPAGRAGAEPRARAGAPTADPGKRQLVDLDQLAAIVRLSKRTMEGYRKRMPPPAIPGKAGRRSLWDWQDVRGWMGSEFGRLLPERFPEWGSEEEEDDPEP